MHYRNSYFDEEDQKELDLKFIQRLWIFIKPYSPVFYVAIVLMLFSTVLSTIRPYISKIIIDNFIMSGKEEGFFTILFIFFATLIVYSATQFGANFLMKSIGQKALFTLRCKVFSHIVRLDISFFDKNPVGRLVTRVTNDIDTISEVLSGGLVVMVIDFILIIAIIVFMFVLNVELTLIILSVLPFLFFTTLFFRRTLRKVFRKIRLSISKINSFLNEFLSGILTIKLFRKESVFLVNFARLNQENKNYWLKTIFYFAIFYPMVEFVSTVALVLIIWFTARNILSGEMTLGIFFAFIQYAEMFFRPIRDLTEKFTNLQNAMASSERIFAILDLKPKIKPKFNPVPFCSFINSIEFKNVTFSYDGINPVVFDISFEVKRGETVAIIGPTGSGKTTLINLLARFYEIEKGKILIDGIDIKDYDIQDLRNRISIVSQDVFLFSRDIKDNILFANSEISEEIIFSTFHNMGFVDFFSEFPNGLKTKVFEKGLTLSAGQRQLISIARALVKNPEILILDEATSNIDSYYESLIENAINSILKDRSAIVIAHRLSTIRKADKIIVLNKGRIIETGTHSELIKKDGIYSKLFKIHFENKTDKSF
ncbi:MAG: ABC transporter ATP-binding protein [Candidatus Kapaibacteriales bacterium]